MRRKKKENRETRQFRYFLVLVGKLPADEFIGIARILRTSIVDLETNEPRAFEAIYEDILDEFLRLEEVERANLIWIMEAALAKNEESEFHADPKYKKIPMDLLTPRATLEMEES